MAISAAAPTWSFGHEPAQCGATRAKLENDGVGDVLQARCRDTAMGQSEIHAFPSCSSTGVTRPWKVTSELKQISHDRRWTRPSGPKIAAHPVRIANASKGPQ
jgi:hypothetical protein